MICLSPNGVDAYRLTEIPACLLVGTVDGLVEVRSDARNGWTVARTSLRGVHVSSLMLEPESGSVFAGSHEHGIFRSSDGGATWDEKSTGLGSRNVFSLHSRREGAATSLYAGTEPAYLFRSRDNGETWVELDALRGIPGREKWDFPPPPHIAHVKNLQFDPHDPQGMYLSVEQGALLRSTDGGASYVQLLYQDDTYQYNQDVHRIAFNPTVPGDFVLSGGDGLARTLDGGKTWRHIATRAMRVGYPDQTFFSPDGDGVIFTMGARANPGTWRAEGDAQATVVRSDDGGATWNDVGGGFPASLRGSIEAATMFTWPAGFGFFVGTTDGEVFASFDRGRSWSQIAGGLPAVSKCVHYRVMTAGRAG
jgi:photosystem II stability/assembly factor-like uncharacterized protein